MGVINVITKSPDESRKFGGVVSSSIGERNTGDYRGEVSGKVAGVGYYLSGGGLLSDGLLSHNGFHGGNFYTKLKSSPTDRADLTFTLGYNRGAREIGEDPLYGSLLTETINIFLLLWGLIIPLPRTLRWNSHSGRRGGTMNNARTIC